MRPELRETLDFLKPRLAGGTRRLLEVGAGEGDLAGVLAALGHRVTALDADADSVEAARRRGLDARVARWPDFEGGPYDAILFARSLHHMEDLDGTVRRAREVLGPGGVLLAEEFDVAGVDAPTLDWFTGAARRCAAAVPIGADPPALVTAAIDKGATLESWAEEHGPHLHTAEAMQRAIGEHFDLDPIATAPYLYRYLAWAMPETPAATDLLEKILEEERRLGASGVIRFLGRRFAGRTIG
ncbi:MAG: class I SAM-dependent methyltransferase [Candidatus Polarisedimenticolia bacterium]